MTEFRVIFEYTPGEEVIIKGLDNTHGFVTSLWWGDRGLQYEVAYFHEGERRKEYLLGCELGPAQEITIRVGFKQGP